MRKNPILYLNIFLVLIVAVFMVNTFSVSGHKLIQTVWAQVCSFSSVCGSGTVNSIAKFAAAGNPSSTIGDSSIYDDGAGHVGIGTTTPGYKLTINTNDSSQSQITIKNSYSTAGIVGGAGLNFDNGVTQAGLTLTNQNRNAYGSLTANSLGMYTANTAGIFFMVDAAGTIRFSTGGSTERMRITEQGNVGIGNVSPSTRLQIGDGTDGWVNGLTIHSSYPTIYLRDIDGQSSMIHVNDNQMYFLSSSNSNPASGNTWAVPAGATSWPLRIDMSTGTAFFGRAIGLYPQAADPLNLTDGMMWMR